MELLKNGLPSTKKIASYLVILSTLFLYLYPSSVTALTTTLTTGSDWEAGQLTNLDTSVKEGDLQLITNGAWGARSWRTPDLVMSIGTALTSDGTDIYVTRGLGDVRFWKYNTTTDAWSDLADLPFGAYYGSELEYLDGYIYALFGGYQKAFARYSLADDSWEVLANLADLVYSGGSLTTDGTYIYALRGNNSQDFYRYDTVTNSWTPLAAPPATIYGGANLVRVGNYLYTPRGNSTATFYRYDLNAGTWSTLAVIPATLTDDIEITTDGTYIYVTRQNNTASFYRYNIAAGTWSTLTDLPIIARYAGSVYHQNDGYLYIFRGNNQYDFWKYDVDNDTFIGPTDAPASLSTGSDMIRVGDYLYVPRGSGTTTFYRYDLSGDTWTTLTAAPATLTDDTKGVAVNSDIYFFRGNNTLTFYKYNIAGNSWTTLTDTPAAVRFGGTLSYPGSGDFIYGTRGATTSSFWRYSISGATWSDEAASDLPTDAESSYGSRLISDGTDLYYLPGIGIKRFFKYTIETNTWSEMADPPFAPYYGTDLEYADNTIIALAGWYKNDVWEYSLANNSWQKLPSLAGYRAQNIGPYTGASIVFDGSSTYYISRGAGLVNLLTYNPGLTNYVSSGLWISATIDLSYVSSWTSFNTSDSTPNDSSLTYQTRTSSDGSSWTSWETVVDSNLVSTPNRYLQIKAILTATSNGENTPLIEDITITYEGDNTNPQNPTSIVASSQQIGGETLTSGESYTHINPYFTWSGAVDNETSIAGYYIYFGTNNLADPELVGEYQTTSHYLVTKSFSTDTYYLRLKTKDAAGNISDATTAFIYDYTGISPAQSLLVDNSTDLTGVATNINLADDEIKLATDSGGFWEQTTLSTPPGTMQYGARNVAYVDSLEKLYAFRGNNSAVFYEYDLTNDAWSTLSNAPGNVRMGGGVVEGPSGYLYGLQGNNSTSFWRYDLTEDEWSDEAATDAPLTVYYGGSLVSDGSQYIYITRGNNDDVFWRYDTSADSWENLSTADFGATTDAINNNIYAGGDLAIDLTNELIYATQGNYRDGFAVYSINTNSWTTLPDLPALPYLGSSIEYVASENSIYFAMGNTSEKMFKFDVALETWSAVSDAPTVFNYGGTLRHVDGYLYAILGGNTTGFYKYNLSKDSWQIPNRGIFGTEFQNIVYLSTNYGADILKGDGDNFYLMRGNFADDFIRWNSTTGLTTRLANLPVGVYQGSALVYDNTANKIYLSGSMYVDRLYVYDIDTNTWSEETADPLPITFGYGSSMVYDGSRYIYANRGIGTTSFYRFDTQGESGNKWSTISNAPAGLGYGAELLIDSNYIYTLRGQNVANNPFYRYDITANTWSDPAVADLNIDVYNDGFLTNGGNGKFYAARGENDTDFYEYSVTNNTWSQLEDAPAKIYTGGSGESNESNKVFVLTGAGTASNADAIYSYVMETASSSFQESGSYISASHDLTSVYKWASLEVDYTSATNTSLSIYTRSSSNEIDWSSWTAVAASKQLDTMFTYQIKSSPARYLQIKFEFTSADGINSGVINDYTINYFSDTTAPTNPTTEGFSAYSDSTPGSAIVTNTWYNHSQPYFDWPDAEETYGASDTSTGSGVTGYYVYFDTDENADPAVSGTFQTTSSYTGGSLVDGQTYYLRIKTIDDANNTAATSWQPLIYKYDSDNSSAPANLDADPSGYTATNSFDFTWDEASASGATITSYCYKTGAETGEYATDQCIAENTITDLPAYRVGSNTFMVRSLDAAGNYSAYTTTSYYYVDSENAPAPPINLTVTPTSNTANSFAFSWSPPAAGTFYGSASNLSYYYSINALPTASNTTSTSLTSLRAGAYATLPGTNVFYIVTQDEAGNVNYDDYASVEFEANTVAPGIPLNIDVADVSVKSTSSWKLAISWEEPASVGSGVNSYSVSRSTDGITFSNIGTSGGISFVDVSLSQQTYYYKVKACDNTNNCGAFSEAVSLYPDGKFTTAAELISDPVVSSVTTRKATVSWTTARTADSKIAYGTGSGDYFDEEVSNSDQLTSHTLNLSNLSPGTTYYYVARWTDEDGNMGESTEASFSTLPAPSTEEPTVSSVGLDFAIIEFTSKNATSVRVYYGESSAFGGTKDLAVSSSEGRHTVQLTELTDGTKYFYKINSFDSDGSEYEGEIHSFVTLPRPKITNVKINQVKGTALSTLLITWDSNTEVSSIVTYYPSNSPASARDEVNVALKTGRHQMVISNLQPQTSYALQIKGSDVAGNQASSEVIQIATSADTRPPQISNLRVEGEVVGNGEEATAQIVVSYSTDEASTSQVEFGEGSGTTYSQKTQEDGSFTNHHLIVISGLSPAKVYHLRALSKDTYGNLAESTDKVIITPKATESALELVITNLSVVFGFLQK